MTSRLQQLSSTAEQKVPFYSFDVVTLTRRSSCLPGNAVLSVNATWQLARDRLFCVPGENVNFDFVIHQN